MYWEHLCSAEKQELLSRKNQILKFPSEAKTITMNGHSSTRGKTSSKETARHGGTAGSRIGTTRKKKAATLKRVDLKLTENDSRMDNLEHRADALIASLLSKHAK